jgi:hypothetical protein
MSGSHPYLFDHLTDLLCKIDQCKYTLERAECILELLHFCADEGRVLLEADERVRDMMLRRCREYRETATYYQEIAAEAARILTRLMEGPTDPLTATATSSTEQPITYDPRAHHC